MTVPDSDPPGLAAELPAMMRLLAGLRPRAATITVGSGRAPHAVAAATAVADRWVAGGGEVVDVVTWPETAASWLRPARRLTRGGPDAWVVAGPLPGWVAMSRRLRAGTDWDPARTLGFSTLGVACLGELAGWATVAGMRGVLSQGGTWYCSDTGIKAYGPDGAPVGVPRGPAEHPPAGGQ